MESPADRQQNIADAFECSTSVENRRYILIDDVVTTGSTMSDCAQALKDAGALNVWGIAFARQSLHPPDDDSERDVSRIWI